MQFEEDMIWMTTEAKLRGMVGVARSRVEDSSAILLGTFFPDTFEAVVGALTQNAVESETIGSALWPSLAIRGDDRRTPIKVVRPEFFRNLPPFIEESGSTAVPIHVMMAEHYPRPEPERLLRSWAEGLPPRIHFVLQRIAGFSIPADVWIGKDRGTVQGLRRPACPRTGGVVPSQPAPERLKTKTVSKIWGILLTAA